MLHDLINIFVLVSISFQITLAAENDVVNYTALFGKSPRADLDFPSLAKYDGYEVETHTVTTSDGYIMDMFRLPLKTSCTPDVNRVSIMFMHGLYLSGDDCLIPGPGQAHCSIYADNCYDVWVPNVRGNRYGRKHKTLNPDKDSEFWNFAVDEMALIDLPTFIDYVLNKTGSSQLAYVGHSQAVGMLLILCAKQPEYNKKIKAGFGLSATAWLEHARFFVIPLQGLSAGLTDAFPNSSNFEILRHGGFTQKSAEALCGTSELEYPLCSVLIFAALGYNKFQITDETLKVLVGHVPSGTSFKDFTRWGQMKNNGFSEYDYGIIKNLQRYGSTKPPLFDLSPITMDWYFIASENDYVGDVRDIATLINHLNPNTARLCILPDKSFGHLDFIYGKDIPNYITPKILSVLSGGQFIEGEVETRDHSSQQALQLSLIGISGLKEQTLR